MKTGVKYDLVVECFVNHEGEAQMHILDLPISWSDKQRNAFIDLSCGIEKLFKKQFSSIPQLVEAPEDIDPFELIDAITGGAGSVDPEIETLSFKKAINERLDRRSRGKAEGYGNNPLSHFTHPEYSRKYKAGALFPDKCPKLAAIQRERANKSIADYLSLARKLEEEENAKENT